MTMAASKKKLKKVTKVKIKSKKIAPKRKAVKKIVRKKLVKKKAAKIIVRKISPRDRKKTKLDLRRHHGNPIIVPRSENYWEARAAFNPTALIVDGKVHILYRAI